MQLGFLILLTAVISVAVRSSDGSEPGFQSDVVVLTSKNFEHLTQAATGATTGDWFIKFYAPWCGHCKKLEPVWDEIALELKNPEDGKAVNVAKVDVSQNRDLGTRFEIQGFPTLKLISKGKVYTFKGRRSKEELVEFAKGGFAMHEPEQVPEPMGMFGEIYQIYKSAYKSAAKQVKAGKYFSAEIFLMVMPLLFLSFGVLICLIPTMPAEMRVEGAKKKAEAAAVAAAEQKEMKKE